MKVAQKLICCLVLVAFLGAIVGCASDTMARNTAGGTLAGAGIGAALGAIIGAITGSPETGAWVGAATGAVAGGLTGAAVGQDIKNRRAAGLLVPPSPLNITHYDPRYQDGLWRCYDGYRWLWWDEPNETWRY